MIDPHSANGRPPARGPLTRARTAIALVGAVSFFAFQATAVALVPFSLSSLNPLLSLGAFHFSGAPLVMLGGLAILWSDWLFVRQGRGTPAPYDPPRALVV